MKAYFLRSILVLTVIFGSSWVLLAGTTNGSGPVVEQHMAASGNGDQIFGDPNVAEQSDSSLPASTYDGQSPVDGDDQSFAGCWAQRQACIAFGRPAIICARDLYLCESACVIDNVINPNIDQLAIC